MSFQFHGKEFTFTQPDGTQFPVRGWGDQHRATFETLDGHAVVRNPRTGFWEVAELSPDGEALVPTGAPAHAFDRAAHAASRGIRVSRDAAVAAGLDGFLKEALDHLKSQGFDFHQLTVDNEGYIYATNVYYAGSCPNNWSEGLWPHAWSLAASYDTGSGRKAFDYQFTDMGQELALATFCHENGHMVCDYPDLYDYGYESSGVGAFCLMCAGGRDEKNPVQISAYLKRAAGWSSSVTQITHEARVQLTAGQNQFAIHAKSPTEYPGLGGRPARAVGTTSASARSLGRLSRQHPHHVHEGHGSRVELVGRRTDPWCLETARFRSRRSGCRQA